MKVPEAEDNYLLTWLKSIRRTNWELAVLEALCNIH